MRTVTMLLLLLFCVPAAAAPPASSPGSPPPYDAAAAARQVESILAGLGDRRLLAANQVFSGVTIAPTSSAERYLKIMDEAFSRSLGVDCTHCHDPRDWARDARHKFAVTRAMWSMVYGINQDQLRKIEGLDRKARVNCTTCHRGELKPALDLD
ncbi:MAG: photosynthetic reaction center cytochrome c subunit family protein [Candidatus Krumholzibacteriia bacterium]